MYNKLFFTILFIVATFSVAFANETTNSIITIGEGAYQGSTNHVIQQAINDQYEQGGGTVVIPEGTYIMHDALHLKPGVHIEGKGKKTVLFKKPSVKVKLTQFHGYGHYEVVVDEPDKLKVGMGVVIRDESTYGFRVTTTKLVEREGNAFFIDQPLKSDYKPQRDASLTSVFPIICGRGVENCSVSNLCLDGNPKEERGVGGCRGGGVWLLGCNDITLSGLEIRNYQGDGISFQQCWDIAITNCHVYHNQNHGLHPGSGSVRYIIRDCQIHHNGGNGIFYCLRTTHSLCEGNRIHDNQLEGISIGERDTDHIIQDNFIYHNDKEGILFRDAAQQGGDRVLVKNNNLKNNCRKSGKAEILVGKGISDLIFTQNNFNPQDNKERSIPVLSVSDGTSNIYFHDNKVAGILQNSDDLSDDTGDVIFSLPGHFFDIGPGAAGSNAARHLGIKNIETEFSVPSLEK